MDHGNEAGQICKHLLIGNGFSIALHNKFNYTSLFEEAGLTEVEKRLFGKSHDFERTLLKLTGTIETLRALELDEPGIVSDIQAKIEAIKEKLIIAVRSIHPTKLDDILEYKYIDLIIDKLDIFENIFDLNYDLILYWIIMERRRKKPYDKYRWQDGFRGTPPRWPGNSEGANFFNLHGSIYFINPSYADPTYSYELEKLKWDDDYPILHKVIEHISLGNPPYYVCEGSSEEKLNHILHSNYLTFTLNKLKNIEGKLVLYGVSLHDNDKHIWKIIAQNKKITELYISYYGLEEPIKTKAQQHFCDFEGKIKFYPSKKLFEGILSD